MSLDTSQIGKTLPPVSMTVDAGRLRFFADATGETNPIYFDVDAAKTAGHPGLPVPPSFLFGVELERDDPFAFLTALGADLRYVLHGEQSFAYHCMAYAGDTITATPRVTDVYSKRGGALQFVVKETELVREGDGAAIATLISTLVIRNPGASS
jgi:acyl dehydratase